MEKLKHYIVTRFNLGLYRVNRDPDKWFAERMTIFREITLPSMRRQTNQRFTWALLIDRDTPKNHHDQLWECFAENALFGFNFNLVYIDLQKSWHPKKYGERWSCAIDYSNFINSVTKESKIIVQTRFDNDDALMPEGIERIQSLFVKSRQPYCIDFPNGYVMDSVNKKTYEASHPYGTPFISFYQLANRLKFKCVYDLIHYKLSTSFRKITGNDRIWIMNIHGSNVSNRMFPWLIEKEISLKLYG